VHGGKIVRQAEVVSRDAQAEHISGR
jgi:hypothetical protein